MTSPRLFANVIGGALIGGFLGALFALFLLPVPEANRDLITYMLGQLSGFAGGIIASHYASKPPDAAAQTLDAARTRNLSKSLDLAGAALAATPAKDGPTGRPDDPVYVEEPTT